MESPTPQQSSELFGDWETSRSAWMSNPVSFLRYDHHWTGPMLTLIVGEDEKELGVHEAALPEGCRFREALEKFEIRTFDLRDEDLKIVNEWVNYLNRKVPLYRLQGVQRDQRFLAELYVFGTKMRDKEFTARLLTDMLRCFQNGDENGVRFYPHEDTVETIFNSIRMNNPARSLLVDIFIVFGQPEWIWSGHSRYHTEFLEEVAAEVFRAREEGFHIWYDPKTSLLRKMIQ